MWYQTKGKVTNDSLPELPDITKSGIFKSKMVNFHFSDFSARQKVYTLISN